MNAPGDCLTAGPSETLTNLAVIGLFYPSLPLPAYPPPTDLNDLPYRYFKLPQTGATIYPSLDDLLANQNGRVIPPGNHLFVSYLNGPMDTDQGGVYELRSGGWVKAEGGRQAIPTFQGLLFSSQPRNAFGWVLEQTESLSAPGADSAGTGKTYYRYDKVQVYDIQSAGGVDWLLIGPGEWLNYRSVARVDPRTTRPEGVTTDRWIEVSLAEQTLAVYQNDRLVFATLVSSGTGGWATHPGLFQIYKKLAVTPMSGFTEADRSDYYYLEDVPWTMYFDEDRALHGEYWHTKLGYPQSHGCVNLSVGDSHWLYNWASEGDYVYVFGALP